MVLDGIGQVQNADFLLLMITYWVGKDAFRLPAFRLPAFRLPALRLSCASPLLRFASPAFRLLSVLPPVCYYYFYVYISK